MIKKILLWVWGLAVSVLLVVVLINVSGTTFGDGTVQNFPTWFTSGAAIGQTSNKTNTKVRAIISSSTQQSSFTLGAYQNTTSSLFTTMTVPYDSYDTEGPIHVGSPCIAWLTTAPTSTAFGIDGGVTAVSTTAQTATVGITYWNGTSTAVTVATGTLSVTCFATPF